MNNSRSLSFENLFLVLFQGFMCGKKAITTNLLLLKTIKGEYLWKGSYTF